jgi:hypothetical protein
MLLITQWFPEYSTMLMYPYITMHYMNIDVVSLEAKYSSLSKRKSRDSIIGRCVASIVCEIIFYFIRYQDKTRTRKPGAEGFCLCKDVYQSHNASFLNALYTFCVLILIVYKCQETNDSTTSRNEDIAEKTVLSYLPLAAKL